jgi:hypothetical protein
MRPMRMLRRLVTMAIVASAMIVPSASAQIEMLDEGTGAHCASVQVANHVVSGGCPLHLTSNGEVTIRNGGAIVAICKMEFEARVNETGHGYFYNQVLSGPMLMACAYEPCGEGAAGTGAKEPWEFQMSEPAPATERLTTTFCISPIGTMGSKVRCTLPLTMTGIGTNGHTLHLRATLLACTNAPFTSFSFNGEWVAEAGTPPHVDIEVLHG